MTKRDEVQTDEEHEREYRMRGGSLALQRAGEELGETHWNEFVGPTKHDEYVSGFTHGFKHGYEQAILDVKKEVAHGGVSG